MPIDKGCYYLYDVNQGSKDWLEMRKGRITMSNLGKVVGHAPYYKGTMEELALEIKGKLKVKHSKEALERMNRGTKYEDKVRRMVSKRINKPIDETGFAVWKEDERFGASLDGVIDKKTGIEIKCPGCMYDPILDYMSETDRDPSKIDHIWKSQYDQVTGNGVITGRKWMWFAVYGIDDKQLFMQRVRVDYDYWDDVLYKRACKFWDDYM